MAFTYTGEMVDLGFGRGWLSRPAAASIRRIDRQIGHPLQITEAGRTWGRQNEHWLTYKRVGWPIALHPDTPSEHQKGLSIDSDEAQRIIAILEDHGWRRTVYRWVNGRWTLVEPWHFEYFLHLDNHRNDPAPSGSNTAAPVPEEDDMIAGRITDSRGVNHHVIIGNGSLRHLIDSDDPEWMKNVTTADDRWTPIPLDRLPSVLRSYSCDLHIWDIRNGSFVVLDPITGVVAPGMLWSAVNALRSTVAAVKVTSEQTKAYVEQLAKAK
jgi:hypothetical protein